MKSITRLLLIPALAGLTIVTAGCGTRGTSTSNNSSNDGGSSPTPSTSQGIQGQWTFTSTADGMQAVVTANITNSGANSFSAPQKSVVVCPIYGTGTPLQIASWAESPTCNISEAALNGTITPPNTVSISISNIQFGGSPSETETATLTGTYTSSGNAITAMQGSFSTSSQDSPMTGGNWTAQPNASFTGTYSGTVNYLNGSIPINVTLSLTQNANYSITGTATLTNDPCYAGWTFSGSVIGGGFGALIDGGNVVVGAIQTSSDGFVFGYKSINGCSTAGVGVIGTSTQTQAVRVTEAQKAMLANVLNALQASAKERIAEKQRELVRRELQIFQ